MSPRFFGKRLAELRIKFSDRVIRSIGAKRKLAVCIFACNIDAERCDIIYHFVSRIVLIINIRARIEAFSYAEVIEMDRARLTNRCCGNETVKILFEKTAFLILFVRDLIRVSAVEYFYN